MIEQRFKELFHRYISQSCTQQEEIELMQLLNDPALEVIKNVLIEEAYDQLPERYQMTDAQGDMIFQQIMGKKAPVITMQHAKKFFTIRRIAVAASIILMVGVGSYFLFFNKAAKKNDIVKTNNTVPHDVAPPKGTKAMITLTNGKKVFLDSLISGTLAIQGNVNVIKTADGQIVYTGAGNEVAYNTLFNPRSSKAVNLTLIDGTKVWMNAESSLKYFTSIGSGERRVEITGECYFEAAHDALKPFIVKDVNRNTEVQVLGTHFNVNTYADEPVMKVTLLEGSVKVLKGTAVSILKPGQQAQISNDIKVVNNVDVEEVMAWKNGKFAYNNTDLETIMRQMARWYDVDVVYKDKITDRYTVTTARDVPVSQLFKYIEMSGGVHFTIEDRKITVMK
jgi:transmembrane sensor